MKYCCKMMKNQIEYICEQHQYNMWECPDLIMIYNEKTKEYGIPIHTGGPVYMLIQYCPWCGKKLQNKVTKKKKIEKVNILDKLIEKSISSDEAYDIIDDIVGNDELDDIQKELVLDNYEWTAICHALDIEVLAQWRKNGWPKSCEYCGREIDYHNWYWTIKNDKLKCLECEM